MKSRHHFKWFGFSVVFCSEPCSAYHGGDDRNDNGDDEIADDDGEDDADDADDDAELGTRCCYQIFRSLGNVT